MNKRIKIKAPYQLVRALSFIYFPYLIIFKT